MKPLDPIIFGLSSRTSLMEDKKSIAIVVDRKSRIIMKDGRRILEQASAIMKTDIRPVVLLTSAPICGKTKKFLTENSISIKSLN